MCDVCKSDNVSVIIESTTAGIIYYYKCLSCGHVWTVYK